jgi:hypothetical protein
LTGITQDEGIDITFTQPSIPETYPSHLSSTDTQNDADDVIVKDTYEYFDEISLNSKADTLMADRRVAHFELTNQRSTLRYSQSIPRETYSYCEETGYSNTVDVMGPSETYAFEYSPTQIVSTTEDEPSSQYHGMICEQSEYSSSRNRESRESTRLDDSSVDVTVYNKNPSSNEIELLSVTHASLSGLRECETYDHNGLHENKYDDDNQTIEENNLLNEIVYCADDVKRPKEDCYDDIDSGAQQKLSNNRPALDEETNIRSQKSCSFYEPTVADESQYRLSRENDDAGKSHSFLQSSIDPDETRLTFNESFTDIANPRDKFLIRQTSCNPDIQPVWEGVASIPNMKSSGSNARSHNETKRLTHMHHKVDNVYCDFDSSSALIKKVL